MKRCRPNLTKSRRRISILIWWTRRTLFCEIAAPLFRLCRQSSSAPCRMTVAICCFAGRKRHRLLTQEPRPQNGSSRFSGARNLSIRRKRIAFGLSGYHRKNCASMPAVLERVEAVRPYRLGSNRANDERTGSDTALFRRNAPANKRIFMLIPKTSSESQDHISLWHFCRGHVISKYRTIRNFRSDVVSVRRFIFCNAHGLGSKCLRAVEKRLPILSRDRLQQFPMAAGRDDKHSGRPSRQPRKPCWMPARNTRTHPLPIFTTL